MFSHLSVILFTGKGDGVSRWVSREGCRGCVFLGVHGVCVAYPPPPPPPPRYGQAAVSTHPTGMYSCFVSKNTGKKLRPQGILSWWEPDNPVRKDVLRSERILFGNSVKYY